MTREYHTSVLLQETLANLSVREGEKYIDATLGGGGHTEAILDLGGIILGIDQDDDALTYVKEKFQEPILKSKVTVAKGNFSWIGEIAHEHGFDHVAGILFDLGVSGHQLDEGSRGFSFMSDAPLDMRMDQTLHVKARDLVNGLTAHELSQIFEKYGEERFSKRIANEIVKRRSTIPIETTTELASVVKRSYPRFLKDKIHPATRVFQALRIAVNDEMRSIETALPEAVSLLQSGGRLAVISFHSLEDRIVKQSFVEFERKGLGRIVTKKPITATEEEIVRNTRSRSAKLRVFEKK
jgi:16S rRNA (cytosine1402-N4)-methyltransferase